VIKNQSQKPTRRTSRAPSPKNMTRRVLVSRAVVSTTACRAAWSSPHRRPASSWAGTFQGHRQRPEQPRRWPTRRKLTRQARVSLAANYTKASTSAGASTTVLSMFYDAHTNGKHQLHLRQRRRTRTAQTNDLIYIPKEHLGNELPSRCRSPWPASLMRTTAADQARGRSKR